jgi:glycosyltransferase involved in cell wall biosynthesis
MKISVITPVYNGEKFIEETILSILEAGEGYDIDYLVIDDGSTDQTSQILRKYSTKIRVLWQENSGESAAVNRGFIEAQGDYLLVVSADDPLFTNLIFDGVVEFFQNNPEKVVWYPSWNMIDKDGKLVRTVQVDNYSDEKMIGKFICLPGPGSFIRKSAALQIGGRREKWKYVGDYDFWLRISRVGVLEKREGVLAQWRLHEESSSIAERGTRMFNERIGVIEEFVNEFSIPEPLARMARAHSLYFAAQLSFFSPDINGRKTILRALRIRRGWIENSRISVVIFLIASPASVIFSPLTRKTLSILQKIS